MVLSNIFLGGIMFSCSLDSFSNKILPFSREKKSRFLNQGPLPRKMPRQKGFGAYRYRFSPFLHGEIKSR
jgi:hypothetical protein